MRLNKVCCAAFFIFLTAYSLRLTACFAQTLSSTELINNAKLYDGKIVSYEGEVIGDVMVRKENAWANINDGVNAIGVWINASLVKNITYEGSYKSIGDRVEVSGIFHRACLEHGGDLDIHALTLRKVNLGRLKQERVNPDKRNQAFILFGVLISVWILSLLKRK